MKASDALSEISGLGAGIIVGGPIIIAGIVAGVLCLPAGLIAGGYYAGTLTAAAVAGAIGPGLLGTVVGVGAGVVAGIVGAVGGFIIGSKVGGLVIDIGVAGGFAAGAIVGAIAGVATKIAGSIVEYAAERIGDGIEFVKSSIKIWSLFKKKSTPESALSERKEHSRDSDFNITGIKGKFGTAADMQAGNDNEQGLKKNTALKFNK